MPWNDDLDPGSLAYAIASDDSARLRLVAGPGTGKSFVLKRRVARLLENGVQPRRLLAVTFTNVAATDLHRELQSLAVVGCDQLSGSTLHSLGMRILNKDHVLQAVGRRARPLFNFETRALICDLSLQFGDMRGIVRRLREYEAAWAKLQPDEPGYAQTEEDRRFEQAAVDWLTFHNCMLVGEIIPVLYRYLRDNPAADVFDDFDHVLVDEFQDLNKADQEVIALLVRNASLCIVGDDDQSLYSFRYAHPQGIREFAQVNPGTSDHQLTECRRCPTRIVRMANSLIRNNVDRMQRALAERPANGEGTIETWQFRTPEAEAAAIARRISQLVRSGVAPGDIIVLAQRASIGRPIRDAIAVSGAPVEALYAEDALNTMVSQERIALLKLVVDRSDRVALRWLLGMTRADCFKRPYARLMAECRRTGLSPWEALTLLTGGQVRVTHTAGLVERFRTIQEQVTTLGGCDLDTFINTWLPEDMAEVEELRQVAEAARGEVHDLEELLREITRLIAQPEIPLEVPNVRVMSLHKSKGLSSPVVFIAGCVEGLLPSPPEEDATPDEAAAHLEEQRRLMFVGLTRVKSDPGRGKPGLLWISSFRTMASGPARRSNIAAAHRNGAAHLNASRFLNELGPTAPAPRAG